MNHIWWRKIQTNPMHCCSSDWKKRFVVTSVTALFIIIMWIVSCSVSLSPRLSMCNSQCSRLIRISHSWGFPCRNWSCQTCQASNISERELLWLKSNALWAIVSSTWLTDEQRTGMSMRRPVHLQSQASILLFKVTGLIMHKTGKKNPIDGHWRTRASPRTITIIIMIKI